MKKKKKVLAMTLVIAMATTTVSSAEITNAAATPKWNITKTSLVKGKSTNFTLKNVASSYKVTFTSSNKKIVKVKKINNKKVNVTAVKKGTATLKAVIKNKKNRTIKTLTKKVTVKNPSSTPKPTPVTTPVVTPNITPTAIPTLAPTLQPTVIPSATPIQSNNSKNWALVIDAKEKEITADGGDNTVLTFKMINTKNQAVDETANDIMLSVTSTFGELSNSDVTIKNGVGTLVLNSEFSAKQLDCKVTADISRQSSNATDLVGKIVGETHVMFEPFKTAEDTTPKLQKAESDQADRVTLFFDRDVKIEDFVRKNEATGTYQTTVDSNGLIHQVFLNSTTNAPVFTISQEDVKGKTVTYPIAGMAESLNDDGTRVNTKVLQLILDESVELDDNNIVKVNYVNAPCGIDSNKSFKLADTKTPKFTAIESVGMKKVKITFSEAIPARQNTEKAGYTINGGTYNVGSTKYGVYNPSTAEDNRSVVILTLGKETEGSQKGQQQYFKAGKAILGITNVIDYAGITDIGKNIISNQTKDFDVVEDANIPTAKVVVESPEQYRITFVGNKDGKECPVFFTNDKKTQIDALVYFSKALQVKVGNKYVSMLEVVNETAKEFKLKDGLVLGSEDGKKATPTLNGLKSFLKVTTVSESEYVVELTEDWTKFYTTQLTNRNFYNDQYQFLFEADTVYNDNNGLLNESDIKLDLNYTGSPLNQQDDDSPEVKNILKTDSDNYFAAEMSEPVQFTTTAGNASNITLAEQQIEQKAMVEFKGIDDNGDIFTFYGKVLGYYGNSAKSDKMLNLEAIYTDKATGTQYTIQQLVDRGWGTKWTLSLTYVYDDVKNAAKTSTVTFEVLPSAGLFSISKVSGSCSATNGTEFDIINVTFTERISDTANALDINRWKLDGYKFPENSKPEVIRQSGSEKTGYLSIQFTVPKGTIRKGKSHLLNVDKSITSIKGNELVGSYENKFVTD